MIEPPDARDPRQAGLALLRAEADWGMIFVRMAAESGSDEEKRDRNRASAQAAYDALVKFAPRVEMSADETREIHGRMEALRAALEAIPATATPASSRRR